LPIISSEVKKKVIKLEFSAFNIKDVFYFFKGKI